MRALPFLLMALLLTSCMMGMEEEPSAVQRAIADGPQTRHYRPVLAAHPDWGLAVTGHSVVLRAEDRHFKLSFRAPHTVVVRAGGTVVGNVEKSSDGAAFQPTDGKDAATTLQCTSATEAKILYGQQSIVVRWNAEGATSEMFRIGAGSGAHQFAITVADNTTQIRSPMNALGVLLMQIDEIPLAQRAGLAWLVTHVDICMGAPSA